MGPREIMITPVLEAVSRASGSPFSGVSTSACPLVLRWVVMHGGVVWLWASTGTSM